MSLRSSGRPHAVQQRGRPSALTSLADDERVHAGSSDRSAGNGTGSARDPITPAVRACFENGGQRVYVARVRPAEFTILRIGQWTADRR